MNAISIIISLSGVSAYAPPVSPAIQLPSAELDTVTLEEYNVVAVKQQANLENLPLAATLLTKTELDELNAISVRSISDVVPNFFMPDYGSRITSSIYVRGIGARMDQPSVGLVVDNVPYLNKNAYDFDLADISGVEMLRGPQSTLFGRNTMGGLINVTTMSPLRGSGFELTEEIGSHLHTRTRMSLRRKISDNLGISLSGNYTWTKGEYENEYNHSEVGGEHSGGARLKAEWKPARSWRLVNALGVTLLRQSGYPYEYLGTGRIEYDDTCYYKRFTLTDGLTATWTGERLSVTSVTSVQHIDDNLTLDQDFLPRDYFTLTQKQKETGLTQDIVVRSIGDDSAYGWLAGLFGFYKHLHMKAPVTFKDTGIGTLIESHRNEANPDYPIKWDSRQFTLNSDFTIPAWGIALYHESTLRLGRFDLRGGLRLDYEHTAMDYRSYCNTGYTIFAPDGSVYRPVPIDIDDYGHLNRHHLTLLPKLGVVYGLDGGSGNVYANVVKGYKSGGYNTQMFSDVLQQRLMSIMGMGGSYDVDDIVGYRPEKSWNFEIGAHLHPADRLGLDVAMFYIDCRDQQLTVFPEGTTTGRMMTNAGHTRSLGAEVSARWQPVESLHINGSYGFTDARFVRYDNGLADYAGKRLPYVPSHTLFVQGVYGWIWEGETVNSLTLDINLRGTGDIYWNEANTRHQKFYALLGAQATLGLLRHLDVSLWGRNLTSTHYDTFYFVSMGNEFVQRAKTLEWGVSVTYTL